jgi:RNA polymerase sigma-70 factor (ECF subfamily)
MDLESSYELIARAQSGDDAALNRLLARYLPRLRRWATGRLPTYARDLGDTNDLVQETLVGAFRNLKKFDNRGEGALQAYLRQAVLNRLRGELRRHGRRPEIEALDEAAADSGESPLALAIGTEAIERYERALAALRPEEREAVIGRIEMGYTYQELADALGKPSADAARKAAERALVRLAEVMGRSPG